MGVLNNIAQAIANRKRFQKLTDRQKDIFEKAYAVMAQEEQWQKELDSFVGQEFNYRIIEGLIRQVGQDKVVKVTLKDGTSLEIRSKSNSELLEEMTRRADPYIGRPS